MAINDIGTFVKPPKKGGGGLGGALGTIGGALIGAGVGAATANPGLGALAGGAVAGAATGAGAGQLVGGLAGEAIDPSNAGAVSPKVERTPLSQFAERSPQVQLAQLNQGMQALQDSPIPRSEALAYGNMIQEAQAKLKQDMSKYGI